MMHFSLHVNVSGHASAWPKTARWFRTRWRAVFEVNFTIKGSLTLSSMFFHLIVAKICLGRSMRVAGTSPFAALLWEGRSLLRTLWLAQPLAEQGRAG